MPKLGDAVYFKMHSLCVLGKIIKLYPLDGDEIKWYCVQDMRNGQKYKVKHKILRKI